MSEERPAGMPPGRETRSDREEAQLVDLLWEAQDLVNHGHDVSSADLRRTVSRPAPAFEDAVMTVNDSDFEDIFCQVDGNDLRLHGWTPSDAEQVAMSPFYFGTSIPQKVAREESISSINLTAYSKLFTPSFAILGREKLAVICRLSQR